MTVDVYKSKMFQKLDTTNCLLFFINNVIMIVYDKCVRHNQDNTLIDYIVTYLKIFVFLVLGQKLNDKKKNSSGASSASDLLKRAKDK